MPLYDFECEKCNHFYEEFHTIADNNLFILNIARDHYFSFMEKCVHTV